ncbi:growth/differentiation factor 8-like [Amphiura filiformis]|uniref:growth/differentiation factor 8-like n=1 Tax=Amphiura filiformis TaxID=82378 RepID=UPI003B20B7AD
MIMLLTVLLLNYCLSTFAHVIPRLPQMSLQEPNIGDNKQALQQPQYQLYESDESDDTSLPPSPVQENNQTNSLDTRTVTTNNHRNQISRITPPDEVGYTTERIARVEVVKQAILKGLSLSEPPNGTEPIRLLPPEILQSLADHRLTHHDHRQHLEDDPDTTKVFVSADTKENVDCDFKDGSQCFRFHFRHQSHGKKLAAARLWVYLLPNPGSSDLQRDITISLPASHYGRRHTLASKETYIQKGWVEIEIPHRRHIMKLFNDSWNFIEVTCKQNVRGNVDSRPSFMPILSLTYTIQNRARRTSNSGRPCNTNANCCLRQLELTFNEIGWDWIQPGSFRADYCTGTCSANRPLVTSARSQIITTFSTRHQVSIGAPCCAPTSYGNLRVVYIDGTSGDLSEQTLPNIRALSCGCVV